MPSAWEYVAAQSCETCARPDRDGPCYRCAVRAVQTALAAHTREPLIRRGDRIAFGRAFLESALQTAQQSPEGRTVYVEVVEVTTNDDGSKIVGVRKRYCPICRADVDETPHEPTHCPALPVPRV